MIHCKLYLKKLLLWTKRLLNEATLFSPSNIAWRRKFNYVREPKIIDISWQKVYTTGVIVVPIDEVYGRIRTLEGLKITPIKNTPHYQWINDIINGADDSVSRATYYDYSKKFFPEEDAGNQLNIIVEMAKSFKKQGGIENTDIVTFLPVLNENSTYFVVLYDGTHRLSIATALGYKFIKCHVVQEKINIHDFI
ncbi:MAG: hypothetical protein Q7K40_02285 [bacterium]|nr:hypothetical protein [bacterium]